MNQESPLFTLSVLHELTLRITGLFSKRASLDSVLQELAGRLHISVICLWRQTPAGYLYLGSAGLGRATRSKIPEYVLHPQMLWEMNLPELSRLEHQSDVQQAGYTLLCCLGEPLSPVYAGILQKLMSPLVQALEHQRVSEENEVLARLPAENPNPILQIGPRGHVTYANTAAGYLLDQWHISLHQPVPDRIYTLVVESRLRGESLIEDLVVGERHYQMLAIYVPSQNHYQLYATDVSQRYLAEQKSLSMRDEAVASSAAKSEFLAIMSHEIRTPLHALLGMLDMLQQQSLEDVASTYVKTARTAGQHLLTLINQTLDFSHLESGKLSLHPAPFHVKHLLKTCVKTFENRAESRGLTLTVHYAEPLWCYWEGDALKLGQVLFILVDNALKFTRKGHIRIEVGMEQTPEHLYFRVSDTGAGIAETQQERIFERFEQADNSSTRSHGGAGLGLSIARRLAELHGGTLYLEESTLNKGSTFRCELPLQRAAAFSEPDEDNATSLSVSQYIARWQKRPPWKLLIVEDGPENRLLMQAYLEQLPVDVHMAENGQAGLKAWKKHRPDLILMDLQMPILDGLSATRALQQLTDNPPPVFALTADVSEQTRQKALEAGCQQILHKPLTAHRLCEALDQVFGATPFHFEPRLARIYPVFFASREEDLNAYAACLAVDPCDWAGLEKLGHRMKGAGSSFGFPQVSQWGEDIESAAIEQQEERVRALFEQLKTYLDTVRPRVEAALAAQDATR